MITTEITRFNLQGKGFTQHAGKNLFFLNAVPGDFVSFHSSFLDNHSKNIDIKDFTFNNQSPRRITPPCSYVNVCGGCQFQHIPYEDQIRWKEETSAHQLRRLLGKNFNESSFSFIKAPSPYHYRQRAALHLKSNAPNCPQIGFFQARSKTLVNIGDCAVFSPTLNKVLLRLQTEITTYHENFPEISLELQELPKEPLGYESRVFLVYHPDRKKLALKNSLLNALIQSSQTWPEVAWGGWAQDAWTSSPCLYDRDILGLDYFAMPKHFMQANFSINILLREFIREILELQSPTTVLDLYAGNGNLSLQASKLGICETTLVEANQNATLALEYAVQHNRLENVYVINRDVMEFLLEIKHSAPSMFDLVIIDPPREGVRRVLTEIALMRPKDIILVSCDANSFFHSVSLLVKKRYGINKIKAFDMFPQTVHMEFAIWLTKKDEK